MPILYSLLLFVLFSSGVATADSSDTFLLAREASKNRNEQALTSYLSRLQADNYVLAPYVDYWRTMVRLNQLDANEAHAFFDRYPDYPFTERVRTEWLKQLAKRGDWNGFFADYPQRSLDDTAVTCYALMGRAERGEEMALAEGKPLWLTPNEQPENCGLLFDKMQKAGVLTEEDIWARLRLALFEGKMTLARSILQRLPKSEVGDVKALERANTSPQVFLDKKPYSTKTRYGRELNIFAFDRLARVQPQIAYDRWIALNGSYGAEDKDAVWVRMGYHAARRLDPRALSWFNKAKDSALSADQLAWKTRAALREGDWSTVIKTVLEMPPEMQEDPAWKYWRGRAFKEKGETTIATKILLPVSRLHSYYGILAKEDMPYMLINSPEVFKVSEDDIKAVAELPAIQRAMELRKLDLRWEAKAEWQFASTNFDDKMLISAAELAARQDWFDLAILTAEKTGQTHDFDLRYPTPYRDKIQNYCKANSVDEAWVYGVIRQESRFSPIAKSGVGASGLMQLMPATATWLSKRMGVTDYHSGMINDLSTNIQFGTSYLRIVLDQMGGQMAMATAAYNAGPGRAKRWVGAKPMEGAIYAESIPFDETRNYVQKVMSNAYYYAARLGNKPQRMKELLGTVGGGGLPAAVDDTEQKEE